MRWRCSRSTRSYLVRVRVRVRVRWRYSRSSRSYLCAMRGSSGRVCSGSAPSVPSTWLGLGCG